MLRKSSLGKRLGRNRLEDVPYYTGKEPDQPLGRLPLPRVTSSLWHPPCPARWDCEPLELEPMTDTDTDA